MGVCPHKSLLLFQFKFSNKKKAIESGDFSVFQSLPQQQLLNILYLRNEDQRSLLHVAASSGHTEVVKIFSAADPLISGINSADEEGWAPLHSAASSGHVEIVEILLSRGGSTSDKTWSRCRRKRTKRGTLCLVVLQMIQAAINCCCQGHA